MKQEYISFATLNIAIGSRPILTNIDLNICAGESVALIGANGCGKTTLLKVISGILQPKCGQLLINGLRYNIPVQAQQIKQTMGFAPDQPPLYANDTVISYLQFIARLKNVKKSEINNRIEECLTIFDLEAKKSSLLHTLSKGTQQRVNLAQAIINQPQLLLLDEPTNALDPQQCEKLKHLLQKLQAQGVTIVIASHHYSEVIPICNYMLKLSNGSLQKIQTPLSNQEIIQTHDQLNYTT